MSGPISQADSAASIEEKTEPALRSSFELYPSRVAVVGNTQVRRALPKRQRRTIGAWCFADHFGPETLNGKRGMEVGPHPHIGLQTATWLIEGEIVHRDSLGSEQPIYPGQLNLMTAGKGVTHSEEFSGRKITSMHGIQLWVAQPDATRNGEPAFEHHDAIPEATFDNASAKVFLGSFGGATSSARTDTPIVGIEATLGIGSSVFELRKDFEYGLIVLQGMVGFQSHIIAPGNLAYFGADRYELPLTAREPTTFLLIGGAPFPNNPLMWWNFVARNHEEITQAYSDWQSRAERFGQLSSSLDRIEAPKPQFM